ncbi:MAG: hypothetical protein AB1752_01305 [Candidatus Zixiibacteriota bacterium]
MTTSRYRLPRFALFRATVGVRILLFSLLVLVPVIAGHAGAQGLAAELGGDAVTRYNWRGLDFGDGASVQPYLRCAFRGFKAGFWGSYSEGFNEIDTWVSYTFTQTNSIGVTAIATDYYFPGAGIRLFNFHGCDDPGGPGAHLLEIGAVVSAPPSVPLSLSGFVNVHNDPGNNVYIQLDYPVTLGELELGLSVGATPGSKANPSAYGSDDFAVINIGVKGVRKIRFGETDLAVSTATIINPQAEIAYLILGLGI